jgi:O-antigen/teichoic acid export membrane protein
MADSVADSEKPPIPNGPAAVHKDVARNLGAFAVAQLVARLAGLGVVVVVARLLSNEDFGRYSVALALSSMLTLIVESGMGGYLVREGTQAPGRVAVALGHVVTLQAITGAVAVGACAVVAALLDYDRETFIATILLAIASVAMIAQRSFMAILVAINRARASAALQSAQAMLQAAATLGAAIGGSGPAGIAAAVLVSAVVSFPIVYVVVGRRWSGRIRFQREGLWTTLGVGAAYSAAKLGNTLHTYVDAVMVQAIKGNQAAAYYGASYRLLLALRMFPFVYTDGLAQPAARLAHTDRAGLEDIASRAAAQLFIIGLPIAVGGFLLSEDIMTTIFGDRYAPAADAAGLLFLTLAVSFPGQICILTALAMGLERRVALTYGAALVVNVASNAILIPRYGATGAAASMLVSSAVLFGFATALLWSRGLRFSRGDRIVKASIAGAALAATVVLGSSLPLAVLVVLGGAVYTALIVALRTLDADDLAMLPMGSRLGVLVRAG